MPVLIKIAFRNMWEHKAKSLIIGSLVAFGVIILVIGNAMIDSASEGLKSGYIESFTGDVMISGNSEESFSIFGVEDFTGGQDTKIPTILDYEKIVEHLKGDKRVEVATSMATAYSLLSVDGDEDPIGESETDAENVVFGILFGVDASTYFKVFPALELIEGDWLQPGVPGLMITQEHREKLEKKYAHPFKIGDKVLVNGFGPGGMRIRELPIVAIYKRGEINGNAPFMICDIDTVRVFGGLTQGTDASISLEAGQASLLNSENPDDVFGEDVFSGDMVDSSASAGAINADQFQSAQSLVGDTSRREELNQADSGAWNFLLIRLKNHSDATAVIADYQKWAKAEGMDIRVTDWKGASGTFGKFADFIRWAFDFLIFLIVVVAVIIMMNTLVISVIERTAEIGTMRALGAHRSFIRKMFLTETLTLTVFFGLIGSAIAMLGVVILNLIQIPVTNPFAQLLFGGKILHLIPSVSSFVTTIIAVFFVGWLAHLYPVSIALKVQPVKAMQSE